MDPVSILAITNASLGIARSLVHTINELYELAEQYETAALGIRTVATQCNSFRIAVERINKWLVKQTADNRNDLDTEFWDALASNLETGRMVIDDLDLRIAGMKKSPAKFWTRTKYLWNHTIISELQSQIQGLMSAVSLLIHVIDLPDTGPKRSLSRAQSTKLNGLTKSVRNRVNEQHRRIQEDAEQNLLDDADSVPLDNRSGVPIPSRPQTLPAVNQQIQRKPINSGMGRTASEPTIADVAPPPYDFSSEANAMFPASAEKKSFSPPPVSLPENDSKRSASDTVDKLKVKGLSTENKPKRNSWRSMMKIGKKSSQPRTLSDPMDSPDETKESQITAPSMLLDSSDDKREMQATPAAIDSPAGKDNYFDLQAAMSGVSMDESKLYQIDSPLETKSQPLTSASPPVVDFNPPQIIQPAEQKPQTNNPYLAMRLDSEPRSENRLRARPDYSGQRSGSVSNFDRIRPSQRVRGSQDRSASQEPPMRTTSTDSDTLERQLSGPSRLSSLSFFSSDTLQQSWQTTAISGQTAKLTVKFENDVFTNRMSASAARALGVDDAIIVVDGVALATVTLLHRISDGTLDNDTAVVGDEVEFEVMTEHEVRTPQLNFGTSYAHFAKIMEAGEYIYWDPRSIPENLRTVERLRMYRRFEMVRW